MITRKSSAVLALLLSFLIAIPPVALADDTELFTTSANPNVLLMLDTTGSMDTTAGSSTVGELDGSGRSEYPDGHPLEGRLHAAERGLEHPCSDRNVHLQNEQEIQEEHHIVKHPG